MKRKNKNSLNKGFTLVELLATIAVLAILALITIPVVDRSIDRQNERVYQQNVSTAKDALRSWTNENTSDLPEEGETLTITLGTLKDEGLVDRKFKNPKTKKCYSNGTSLQIKNTNGVYIYKLNELIDGNEEDCQNLDYSYYSIPEDSETDILVQTSSRPVGIYLKRRIDSTDDKDTQVCLHDGYNELCFYGDEYETSRAKLKSYVDFNKDVWTSSEKILNDNHEVQYAAPGNKIFCNEAENIFGCAILKIDGNNNRINTFISLYTDGKVSLLKGQQCIVGANETPACSGESKNKIPSLDVSEGESNGDNDSDDECFNCQGPIVNPGKPGYDQEEPTI